MNYILINTIIHIIFILNFISPFFFDHRLVNFCGISVFSDCMERMFDIQKLIQIKKKKKINNKFNFYYRSIQKFIITYINNMRLNILTYFLFIYKVLTYCNNILIIGIHQSLYQINTNLKYIDRYILNVHINIPILHAH